MWLDDPGGILQGEMLSYCYVQLPNEVEGLGFKVEGCSKTSTCAEACSNLTVIP